MKKLSSMIFCHITAEIIIQCDVRHRQIIGKLHAEKMTNVDSSWMDTVLSAEEIVISPNGMDSSCTVSLYMDSSFTVSHGETVHVPSAHGTDSSCTVGSRMDSSCTVSSWMDSSCTVSS